MNKLLPALIIEDDDLWLRYFFETIGRSEHNPFEFLIAHDLREGLEVLETNDIRLIVLDLILPDSQGIETVKSIVELHPYCPVVCVTTLADTQTKESSIGLGAQDFLVKDEYNEKLFFHTALMAIRRSIQQSASAVSTNLLQLTGKLTNLEGRVQETIRMLD